MASGLAFYLAKKFNYIPGRNYKKLYNWTIKNPKLFWTSVWEFSNIKGIKNDKFYFPKEIIKSKFLLKSKLNYAENLLSKNDNSKAVTFISENGYREEKSWKELNKNTLKLINFFKGLLSNKAIFAPADASASLISVPIRPLAPDINITFFDNENSFINLIFL